MTEKRYYQRDFEELYYIIDSNVISEKEFDEKEMYDGYTAFEDSMTGEEIVDRLNELNDENQLLHEINEETINFMYDNFDSNIIFTDRDLNDICNEMGWELSEKGIKIKQLEEENEQLKKELKRCRDWLNSDKNDYQLTLAFIKSKGYSLKDVLEYEKELKE